MNAVNQEDLANANLKLNEYKAKVTALAQHVSELESEYNQFTKINKFVNQQNTRFAELETQFIRDRAKEARGLVNKFIRTINQNNETEETAAE